MNYARLVAAAVVGTLVDAVYGFVVYGMLLASQFGRFPAVYRPNDAPPSYLGAMFVGILIATVFATAIYHKGYEGRGSGAAEGMRFGILLGLFVGVLFASISYGTLAIGRRLAVTLVIAGVVEWTLVGTAIGAIYRPAAAPAARRAAV
jgi:hypothetical protein